MARFSDKCILITGGTSGVGLAGALRVQAEGGRVAVTGRNLSRLQYANSVLYDNALVLRNDVSPEADIDALSEAVEMWGRPDGRWLNAGYAELGDLDSVTAEAFNAMMNANVRGPMLPLARLNPGASVVVTSSSSVYEGAATTSLYVATKGAIVAMVRSWASVLAPRGIRVNVVIPGPIETHFRDFMPNSARQQFEDFIVSQVPLKRAGKAEEAVAVALFLLSSDAAYVTGSQYAVDGGLMRH
ncbi:SDR family oxidoreductase [Candidatus Pantoea persica]|uniref:SDR family oxidoreductase n=1 Tax=Candidatus Pantoea persica TaxID=2518128 RepID=UPI00215DBE22|nr:SDR family oxidoreductase [Candidatus Pantoea persica]MBA2815910.1 Levodione reductase [Candidatus Pantoea persica]